MNGETKRKRKQSYSEFKNFMNKQKKAFKYSLDEREESLIKAVLSVIVGEFYDIRESIPTRRRPMV